MTVREFKAASANPPVLPRGVRRALDAMQAAGSRDIGLPELAAIAGMSARALQRQFRAFLGKTPIEALHDIRFERARRQFLLGTPGRKVMDIAAECGLTHFGRFSVGYRARFGEAPSQTLKRQAAFAGVVSTRLRQPLHLDDRPTLAIGTIDAAPAHREAARTIADELSTALAHTGVGVSSRAEHARYCLAGGIKGEGAQTRLIFRLIDRETGRHLWAHRAEAPFEGPAAFDDQLATRIAAALQPSLRMAEIERAIRKPDRDASAQDLALRALPRVLSLDAENNARACELLDTAMERDPDNALAVALAAWAHGQRVVYHFAFEPQRDRARCRELAMKALTLRADPTVLAIAGNALSLLDEAMAEQVVTRALVADGGSAWAWGRSGWIEAYRGNDEAAIEKLTIALELAPDDPLAFNNMVGLGCAHFNAGRYREAARWQERALREHPSSIWIHRTLSAAYMLGGAAAEARRSLGAWRETCPDLTLSKVTEGFPPMPRAFYERVVQVLDDLGLPS